MFAIPEFSAFLGGPVNYSETSRMRYLLATLEIYRQITAQGVLGARLFWAIRENATLRQGARRTPCYSEATQRENTTDAHEFPNDEL